eukprot:1961790-Pleurochrysis_carterae.AAC.2
MKECRALMDANKPPEPPPKKPILDSFVKGKGFMPPPTQPPDAPFNAVPARLRAVKGKLLSSWSASSSGHLDRTCFQKAGRASTSSRTK